MADTMICRCEEIMESEVLAAIHAGAKTLDDVKRRTRSGMGLCQGKTCSLLVGQQLAMRTGMPPAEIHPGTFRPPVRPIKLSVLANPED